MRLGLGLVVAQDDALAMVGKDEAWAMVSGGAG